MEIDEDALAFVRSVFQNAYSIGGQQYEVRFTDRTYEHLRSLVTTASSDGKAATAEPGEGGVARIVAAGERMAARTGVKFTVDPDKVAAFVAAGPAPPSAQPSKELSALLDYAKAEWVKHTGTPEADQFYLALQIIDKFVKRALALIIEEATTAVAQPPVTDAGKGWEEVVWRTRKTYPPKWIYTDSVKQSADWKRREREVEVFYRARTEATEEKPLPASEGDEGSNG